MITVTDKAALKIKEISEADDIGHFNVRIRVVGGGCAGFSHDVYYEDIISDLDEIEKTKGVTIVIDPLSYQYLDGMEIDYIDGSLSSGFKFNNPNITKTCGCGSSFSA